MAWTTYGKTFRTRKGRYGRYKYVNGRRVSFVATKKRSKLERRFRKAIYNRYQKPYRRY